MEIKRKKKVDFSFDQSFSGGCLDEDQRKQTADFCFSSSVSRGPEIEWGKKERRKRVITTPFCSLVADARKGSPL